MACQNNAQTVIDIVYISDTCGAPLQDPGAFLEMAVMRRGLGVIHSLPLRAPGRESAGATLFDRDIGR